MNLLKGEIDSRWKGRGCIYIGRERRREGSKETEEMASTSNRDDGTCQTCQCILWRDVISVTL